MKRRSFLALAGGAPLAAIIPSIATANNNGRAMIAATAIHASKIEAGSIGCNTLHLANIPIRNATISPFAVFASNIGAGSITDERIRR